MEYSKGVENKAVDALARSMCFQDTDMNRKGLIVVIPLWLDSVKSTMRDSPYYWQLKEKLAQKLLSDIHYREVDGVWYYKGRIMLEPGSDLCKKFFLEHHATPTGGHSGYQHTL